MKLGFSRLSELGKSKFVRSVSVRLLGTAVTTVLAVITSVLTARLLGPSGKGAYFLLYSTLNTLVALAGLKLVFSQAYYRTSMSLGQLLASSFLLSIFSGTAATCIGLAIIWPFLDSVFKEVDLSYVLAVIAMAPALVIATNFRSLLDADYQTTYGTVTITIRPLLFLLFFGSFSVMGWFTVGSALVAMFISIVGMAVIGSAFLLKEARPDYSELLEGIKKQFFYSVRSHLGLVFKTMQSRFDIFIVAYFVDLTAVGLYSVALTISDMAGKLSQVTATVLLSHLAKDKSESMRPDVVVRVSRIMFLVSSLMVITLAVGATSILTIAFGDAFVPSATAIYLLLPGVLAMSIFRNLNLILVMNNRPGLYSGITSVGVATMIIGDVLLIPGLGINGAALASTISFVFTLLVIAISVTRVSSPPFYEYVNVVKAIEDISKFLRRNSASPN